MNEDFLQYVWRTRRFGHKGLKTTQGDAVEILHPGDLNLHDGPDFLNARMKIAGTLWAGNVEVHVNSSDWMRHGHSENVAFDNVILHVVLEEDKPVCDKTGKRLPCLEMRNLIPQRMWSRYLRWVHGDTWIPCQAMFKDVSELTRRLWLDRLLVERLEDKTQRMREALVKNGNNWADTFYEFLARNFGLTANADAFEALAQSLPQKLLARHKDNLLQLEALLFGQAGLLPQGDDDPYPAGLRSEYDFLRKKYGLEPLPASVWNFRRQHPGNFPTVRLAQFAVLAQRSAHLFSRILEVEDQRNIESLFEVKLTGYWQTHYTFGKPANRGPRTLGRQTIRLLTINSIVPFLFLYGTLMDEPLIKDKALHLLQTLPAEKNTITTHWEALGWKPETAFDSQGMIQLKKKYCDARRCLHCAIGSELLNAPGE